MPKGVRGFRWVETGYKVWQLEDRPRHFRGGVMLITGDVFVWSVLAADKKAQGESTSKREAMAEVESRVIPRRNTESARLRAKGKQ